ncbi:hypothetical protein ACFSQJ_01375 [Croceitalea marina]|uniref:Response regulatory domain-containing protein n=1 Tax=Croceitalea marina TaxID=1775166 RepID=A0ABW5MT65_9FLAO
MFEPKNEIIIIDNNAQHLETLSKRFHTNGIGCMEFEYDAMYESPLLGVRIAFFDINLLDLGGGERRIFNTLALALKQYISIDNGPFALVFWTSNSEMIERFKEYVQNRHPDCPKPFVTKFIDKDEFLVGNDGELQNEIENILSDDVLKLMFDFESLVKSASSNVIDEIYKIIPNNDDWGANANFSVNFEKVFSKISTSMRGFDGAKNNPDRAVFEALLPILTHQVMKKVTSNKWRTYLQSLNLATKYGDLRNPNGFRESNLNSVFHIDNEPTTNDARGVVIKMNRHHQKVLGIFGMSYREWLDKFVPFKKNTEIQRASVEALIVKSELVAIEISSSCDYQQDKSRLNKYVYGVKFPIIPKNLLGSSKDSALNISNYVTSNQEFEIWLNLNYVFGARTNDKVFEKSTHLFTFKKEIMDMLGNRYANHVSRIGITSF